MFWGYWWCKSFNHFCRCSKKTNKTKQKNKQTKKKQQQTNKQTNKQQQQNNRKTHNKQEKKEKLNECMLKDQSEDFCFFPKAIGAVFYA